MLSRNDGVRAGDLVINTFTHADAANRYMEVHANLVVLDVNVRHNGFVYITSIRPTPGGKY